MAGGDNHAKRSMQNRLQSFMSMLGNGRHDDPVTHGDMLIFIAEIIEPLFMAEFITIEKCKENRRDCSGQCSTKFTWSMAFATVTVACVISGTILAALKIMQGA